MGFNVIRFKQLQEEELQIAIAKNQDYGSKNITMTGVAGIIVRLVDKSYRALNLANGHDANFEDIRQNLKDISNYCNIGLMLDEGSWEDPTPVKLVYLAGAIDSISRDGALGWRESIAGLLARADIASFDPCAAFRHGSLLTAEKIREINRRAIKTCDAVIAKLDAHALSLGTHREIEFAKTQGKFVVAWIDSDRWLSSLETVDVNIVRSEEEAVRVVAGHATREPHR